MTDSQNKTAQSATVEPTLAQPVIDGQIQNPEVVATPTAPQALAPQTPVGEVVTTEATGSPDALIRMAIERQVPVETLERLLAMRRELKAEQARDAFFAALSSFQSECPVIGKNKTADAGQYKYQYADLAAISKEIQPILKAHGLSYSFDSAFETNEKGGGAQVVTCTVHHSAGHSETSTFRAPIETGARMNEMQKNASSQTYAKRYALCNALGILTGDEDDDAQASGKPAAQRAPAPATRRPAPAPTRPAAPADRLLTEEEIAAGGRIMAFFGIERSLVNGLLVFLGVKSGDFVDMKKSQFDRLARSAKEAKAYADDYIAKNGEPTADAPNPESAQPGDLCRCSNCNAKFQRLSPSKYGNGLIVLCKICGRNSGWPKA